jgi:site-specific recombinase XerC
MLAEGKQPNTRHMRYRSLRRFFRWLKAEVEIDVDPMNGITGPHSMPPAPRSSVNPI